MNVIMHLRSLPTDAAMARAGKGEGDGECDAAATTSALSVSEMSSGATSTNTATNIKSRLYDSIDMLEGGTKSLLRTIRIDMELLASREEEMREEVEKLESQYESLERVMTTHEERMDVEGEASINIRSTTIDCIDVDEVDETETKVIPPTMIPIALPDNEPKRHFQRSYSLRCSRVDWGLSISDSLIELYGEEEEGEDDSPEINTGPPRTEHAHGRWSLFGNEKKLAVQTENPRTSIINKWNGWFRFSFSRLSSTFNSDCTTDATIGTKSFEAPSPQFPDAISSSKITTLAAPSQALQHNMTGIDRSTNDRTLSTDISGACPDEEFVGEAEQEQHLRSSSLQLQLHGCDTAASTLNQLLTCRGRDRLDLQYERASLQRKAFYQQKYSTYELDNLRRQLHQGKVERRRKTRSLENARNELKTTIDMKEQLMEELDSVRRELFMLKLQVDRQE